MKKWLTESKVVLQRIMNQPVMRRVCKKLRFAYRTCKDYSIPRIRKALCFAWRVCENFYFMLRHSCFHILAAFQCPWLPVIRKAERELKPHSEHLRPQYTWIERLGLGLWPMALFILPLVITLAIASTIDLPLLATERLELAGYLKTIATVLATLTGLLLTVIALTIRVKTSNLAGADFLLNAVIRKRGFLPIAAFLSGTILTALAGMLFSDRLAIDTFNNYTGVTALLSFIALLILVNLLQRTMQTLGSSDLEELLRGELLASLRKSFRSTLRQALIERRFSEILADLGFTRYTATPNEEEYPIEYKLKGLGKIVAIDIAPLRQISRILKLTPLSRDRNTSHFLILRPDDSSSLVTIPSNGNVTKDTQLALYTKEKEQNKQITKLIRKAFIIQRHSDDKPPWQRLREVMSAAIERYESTIITTVANTLTDTFDDYLDAQAIVAGQGKLLLEDFIGNIVYDFKPPHPFHLRLSDLALYAVRNRSQDCLNELLTCIYRLAQKSYQKQNEKYYRDWIFEFYWAYHSFGPHTKDSDFNIAPDITQRIHWLSNTLSTDLNTDRKSAEQVKKVTPYAIAYLSLCLHMLKISAERCHGSTFDSVLEHVENFLKHELKQMTYQLNGKDPLIVAYDELLDYKNLVYVTAGAWLTHKVKANELQGEKVRPFIEKLMTNASDFCELLNLYAMPGMADMTTNHDNPLEFGTWDYSHSRYPQARCGTDFQRWIAPFYQFFLLKKVIEPSAGRVELQNVRQTEMASHESLKKFLGEIAGDSYNLPPEYQSFFDTEKLNKAKSVLTKILSH